MDHKEIPQQSLAVNLLHHVAQYTGGIPKTPEQHEHLLHKIVLTSAWLQALAILGTPLGLIAALVWFRRRRLRVANR